MRICLMALAVVAILLGEAANHKVAHSAEIEAALSVNARDNSSANQAAGRRLLAEARAQVSISVIVTLSEATDLEPDERSPAYRSQRARLFAAQDRLVARIHFGTMRLDPADRFETVPMVVMTVTEAELSRLLRDPDVVKVQRNRKVTLKLRLEEMRDITKIESIWGPKVGDKGNGSTIVIIDDGVDSEHPAIKGRIVEERCLSAHKSCYDPVAKKLNALKTSSGKLAAWACATLPEKMHKNGNFCTTHGAQVTAVAAASAVTGVSYNGFGPKLDVVFVRVAINDNTEADYAKLFELAFTAGKLHAAKVITTSIGLVDLRSASICDGALPAFETIISKIVSSGMVVTNSAGNDYSNTDIDFPACHSKVLAVDATAENSGEIVDFSDVSFMSDFLVPGNKVVTGPGATPTAGTSFATPAAAAAIALLHNAFPARPMKDIVTALRCGGTYINRPGTDTSIPLINADASAKILEKPEFHQNFEFDSTAELKGWVKRNNTWQVTGGELVYESTQHFTTSSIYTDLCLDDFVAEARIKTTTTVFDAYNPTVSSHLMFLTSTKGDPKQAAKRPILGYEFRFQKTTNTTSNPAMVLNYKPFYHITSGVAEGTSSAPVACFASNIGVDPAVYNILRVERKGTKMRFLINGVLRCEVIVGKDRFRAVGIFGASPPFAGVTGEVRNPTNIKTQVDYLRIESN